MRRLSRLLLRAGVNYQRRHRWQAFLALAGISLGVAIVIAVDLANSAARASFELSANQLRGAATHRIVGPDGRVPTEAYRTLFTTPGLPPLAPVIRAWVVESGQGRRLQLLGLDLFAESAFRQTLPQTVAAVDLRSWLSTPNQAIVSAAAAATLGVAQGQALALRVQGGQQQLRIAHIHPGQSPVTRDLLLVDIATAQSLLDMRADLSYIDIAAEPQQLPAVRAVLPPGLRLVSIDQQTQSTVGLSAAFELNLTAMGLLALVVGLFLIYNAMSFSVVQRRNLFGRLRAIGTQPWEIYRVVLAEALVLACIGSLIGLLLGILLGQGLTQLVAQTVSELYYRVSADALQLNPLSVAKGLALGLIGTLVATLIPAYQAASTPPVSSLSRSSLEQQTLRWMPRLALAGIALLLSGLALAFVIPGGLGTGLLGLFLLIIGAVLLTPASIPLFHWLLQRVPLGGIWRFAVRDLKRHVSRIGTAAAALMIALSAAVSVAIMVESMRGAVSDWLQSLLNADLYVAAEDFGEGVLLPQGLAQRIESLPQVAQASRYRNLRLDRDNRPLTLVAAHLAPRSRAGFRFVSQPPRRVWDAFDRGALLVSEPLANRLQLEPGGSIALPTPQGERAFEVAGVFRDFASEHGRLFMPWTTFEALWNDTRLTTLALFKRTPTLAQLKQAVTAQAPLDAPLVFTQPDLIYRESMAVFDRTFRVTEVLRALALGVAFVGILSALMAIQLQRRKEFAVLRAIGMTRFRLAQLIVVESLLLGLIAAVLALPTGLLMAWVLTEAIQFKAFGWTMPLTLSAGPQLLNLGLGILAAGLAAIYPAWTAARHDPAPYLRED